MNARILTLAAAMTLAASALAQTAESQADLERIQAHRRVASGYLRTGNADLALMELERLRSAIGADPASPDRGGFAAALARARTGIDESIVAAEQEDLERSRTLLEGAGQILDDWRRGEGIALFSDCIAQVGAAYEVLDVHRTIRPVLSEQAIRDRIEDAARSTQGMLARCDSEAAEEIRADPEFRRLVDGFGASLDRVTEATRKQDGDFLYRLLIEQRSFERLLSFRYG